MQNYNPQMGYPTTGQASIATQYPYGHAAMFSYGVFLTYEQE